MSGRKHRDIECPDCHATPIDRDERIITGSEDGSTTQTWHKEGCPRFGDALVHLEQCGGKVAHLRLVRPDEEPAV